MTIITTVPWTRINDRWIRTNRINATPPDYDIKHSLVTSADGTDTRFFAKFYQHIALDIVTETVFNYPYPYFSEKTFRPMVCKRLFIMLGPPGMIKFLKNKGFEIFDDIINHGYDTIADPEERFVTAIQEIENFCQRPLDEIKQYYRDNQFKFDKNFNQLTVCHQEELKQLRLTL